MKSRNKIKRDILFDPDKFTFPEYLKPENLLVFYYDTSELDLRFLTGLEESIKPSRFFYDKRSESVIAEQRSFINRTKKHRRDCDFKQNGIYINRDLANANVRIAEKKGQDLIKFCFTYAVRGKTVEFINKFIFYEIQKELGLSPFFEGERYRINCFDLTTPRHELHSAVGNKIKRSELSDQ